MGSNRVIIPGETRLLLSGLMSIFTSTGFAVTFVAVTVKVEDVMMLPIFTLFGP